MNGRTHSSCVDKLSPGILVLARMDNVDCTTLAHFGIACDERKKTRKLFNKVACELYCCCAASPSLGYGDTEGQKQNKLYQSCVKVTVQAVDQAMNGASPFKAEHYFNDGAKGFFDLAYVPKNASKPSFISEMKFKNDPENPEQLLRYGRKVGRKNVTETTEKNCGCSAAGKAGGLDQLGIGKDSSAVRDSLDELIKKPNRLGEAGNFSERGSKIAAEVAGNALKKMFGL